MTINPVAFAENIARAYEIARCGNLKLRLITTPNADNLTLHEKDIIFLREFFGIENCDDPDIIIELARPNGAAMLNSFSRKCETKEEIDRRIDAYMLTDFPVFDRTLTGSTVNLLKIAIDRLQLNYTDVLKILNVAEVIAKLSNASKYAVEHVAEAIQYLSVPVEHRY